MRLVSQYENSDMVVPIEMIKKDFYFETPGILFNAGKADFWFEFEDSSGIAHRDPEDGSYIWIIGDENIYKNLTPPNIPQIPADFVLEQNYPNPFNKSTTIAFGQTRDAQVKLSVYDILGRKVAELFNGWLQVGIHRITFTGQNLSSGIYFYRLIAGGFVETRKMILLK